MGRPPRIRAGTGARVGTSSKIRWLLSSRGKPDLPRGGRPPSRGRPPVKRTKGAALGAAAGAVARCSGSPRVLAAALSDVSRQSSAASPRSSAPQRRSASISATAGGRRSSSEIDGRTSELKRALSELEIAQAETVRRLSMAVEFSDEDTGAHIERIGRFSTLLAEHIGMDAEFCERLGHAAPLHDVGKVAIPDAILLKPGPLTPEERAIVETHAEEGHRLVRGSSSSILDMAATIALSHQEKWDGSGYPRGLKGEAIPIEGRIVAVADVFDALTSDRVYRKAFSVEEAVQMMREQRGRHFDPVLLDAFMEVLGQTGPDAREQMRSDPAALVESTLETFASALERGDAEIAEGAIATAIEDGITPTTLHAEVIGPALRRISVLAGAGEIDSEREHRATTITRRVLATLYRYMTGGTEPTRERVLLAGVEGDEHTLGLQMVHDQLAAAGFQTIFDTDLSAPQLAGDASRASRPTSSCSARPRPWSAERSSSRCASCARATRTSRSCSAGPAVGGSLPRERRGMRVLERIDETVEPSKTCSPTSAASHGVRIDSRGVTPRAIVTGGAGFIGSHVVDALLAERLRRDRRRRPLRRRRRPRRRRRRELRELDIVDLPALAAVVAGGRAERDLPPRRAGERRGLGRGPRARLRGERQGHAQRGRGGRPLRRAGRVHLDRRRALRRRCAECPPARTRSPRRCRPTARRSGRPRPT